MSDSILDSVSIINVDNIKDRITRIFDKYLYKMLEKRNLLIKGETYDHM